MFIKLSDTRHIESSSARSFSFVGHSQLSRVEFQRYIFLDPQRGYVTVYWLRIRVLSSPSEGRPLAAVIITTAGPGCLFKFMNSSISYTHSDFLLELSEFPSSLNHRVPKTLKFQKLSSSKNSRVPKVVKFQKLSSSRNSQVPKTLEFQKLSSSKNSRVPRVVKFQKLSSSRNSRVPKTLEFHPSELGFQITSEFQRTEFHHSELQFQFTSVLYSLEFHLQNSSSKILLELHTLFGFHNNSCSTELYRVPSSYN